MLNQDLYGATADLDRLALTGAAKQPLLTNGDFPDDMANWSFSSDKYHLPWRSMSGFMGLLFDESMVGAALLGLLVRVRCGAAVSAQRAATRWHRRWQPAWGDLR